MKTHFEIYAERESGWKFLGTCEGDAVMFMSQAYAKETDTKLLFFDTLLPRPFSVNQKRGLEFDRFYSFNLDNMEHILIQSMFKGSPDILIIPKQEVLDGFKFTDFDYAGYSGTPTAP